MSKLKDIFETAFEDITIFLMWLIFAPLISLVMWLDKDGFEDFY